MNKPHQDNLYIKRIIQEDKPFFIGRIAGCELKVAAAIVQGLPPQIPELRELENNAGIYTSTQISLEMYAKSLVSSYTKCTLIAEWEQTGKVFEKTGSAQEYIAGKTPNIPKINALALEPYYFQPDDSWMGALKQKRILVIHPFVKSFQKQVPFLKLLFPNCPWFEDCTFQFIAPPQTIAGNHQGINWQEHLAPFLKSLGELKDFDIALIAAGGYGMLIADHIFTELGKSAIYIGGALQIFFGVIGKRWFENKDILSLVNDDWIRPEKADKPPNFQGVEKGCYW
jgi:hypothetical protein